MKNLSLFLFAIIINITAIAQQNQQTPKGAKKMVKAFYDYKRGSIITAHTDKNHNIWLSSKNYNYLKKVFKPWQSGARIVIASLNDKAFINCNQFNCNNIITYDTLLNQSRWKLKYKLRKSNNYCLGKIPIELQHGNYEVKLQLTYRKKKYIDILFVKQYAIPNNIILSYKGNTQQISNDFLKKYKESAINTFHTTSILIPFNKTYYKIDSQLLKNSIQQYNFNNTIVNDINIIAYASVDGDSDDNLKLANNRANSIKIELIKNGFDSTICSATLAENWELLYKQAVGEFSHLKDLSKCEVKKLLRDTAFNKNFTQQLDSQRIALIKINFNKPYYLSTLNNYDIIENIKEYIANKQYFDANILLFEILTRIKSGSIPKYTLHSIAIPNNKEANTLLCNYNYCKYLASPQISTYSQSKTKRLLEANPKDKDLLYRLATLQADSVIGKYAFKKSIKQLKRAGISKDDIYKIELIFYSNLAVKQFNQFELRDKAKTSKIVYKLCKKANITDNELINRVKFLDAIYERTLAIKLQQPYINSLKYSNEMLFTYLTLILPIPKYTNKNNFTALADDAIYIDRERFKKFFNSISKGGISFQLLSNPKLYSIYYKNYMLYLSNNSTELKMLNN